MTVLLTLHLPLSADLAADLLLAVDEVLAKHGRTSSLHGNALGDCVVHSAPNDQTRGDP